MPAGDGLPVYRRGESGSKAAEKLRREGKVPGVIFSQVRMRSLPMRCGPVLVMLLLSLTGERAAWEPAKRQDTGLGMQIRRCAQGTRRPPRK